MEKRSLGYIYAIISRFFVLGYFIFATLSFSYYNYLTTSILWFGFAAIFSFFFILFSGKIKEYKSFKKQWKIILVWGFVNGISVLSSFYALSLLGPSLSGFLGKMTVFFIVFAGVLLLRERFNIYEVMSAFVIFFGVIFISFSEGEYIIKGVILLIIYAIFYTIGKVIIKAKLVSIDPMINVNYRATIVAILLFIFALVIGKFEIYVSKGLLFATVPAIFSAVFNHYFTFKAYKYIEMSKVALIGALSPLLIAFVSFLVFREVLTFLQFSGGMLIVVGVVGLIYSRKKVVKNKNAISE